ncbi:MAG: adenylyltransferase/cytidyltransferase family protein [Flavobacteriales bacterium]|nr:adenylyltransferase/cytidyltransferase family protein [Flavobacteriales bacterium]
MSRLQRIEDKIIDSGNLSAVTQRNRAKGKRIVFTNGVFDILHRGHVTLLNAASELGDYLILGLNSDQSVRTLNKGPERPINKEKDRAMVLASLQCVDAVVIFSESTPYHLIESIRPDVLVKGGDYDPNETNQSSKTYVVGSDIQRANAKITATIPLVDGYSTTAIIKKSKND